MLLLDKLFIIKFWNLTYVNNILVHTKIFFGPREGLKSNQLIFINSFIFRVKSFHVKILLLDKQELIQEVTEITTGQDLLDNIFKYLNLIETAYFGLRFQDNDNQTVIEFCFVKVARLRNSYIF